MSPEQVNAQLQERLLDAAWSLLTKPGPAERLTLTRLCGAAECTPRSVYQQFDSLEALLGHTSERALARWADHIQSEVANIDDPAKRLYRRGKAYLEWGIEHPEEYRALFETMARGRQRAPGPGFDDLLADVAAARGLGADDPCVRVLGLAHWAGVHGLTSLAISPSGVPTDLLRTAYEHLCSGLIPAQQA